MIPDTEAWTAVQRHHAARAEAHLRDLFADDPRRGGEMVVTGGDLALDYSKQRIDRRGIDLLVDLADDAQLTSRIGAMFDGEPINTTERRAALHTALRRPRDDTLTVDGTDVVSEVHDVLDRMAEFCDSVRAGAWTGATGERIRSVVNIGIGGSHLGPQMAVRALHADVDRHLDFAFVSNVDGADLASALAPLDPGETLFVICSKSFTTLETLTNASSARAWVTDALGEAAVAEHFAAVSTNEALVRDFGIDPTNMFGFWDWVGGRFSLDSAIGLSVMLAIGAEAFRDFLAGFAVMDAHFREAPLAENLPVLLGLIGVWNRNLFGWSTHAVIPYSSALDRFPAYLQQLEMESNGKSVRHDGSAVDLETAPVIWGEPGTDGQHAFFQMLHQGTTVVPADLIVFARPEVEMPGHHDLLVANALAQAEALAFGRTGEEVQAAGVAESLVAHRSFAGNRPTNMLMAPKLSPSVLGQLVAAYEHKVFTQGVIWGVDSFDQWGVELGKHLASTIAAELADDVAQPHDSSTTALIARYRSWRGG